MRKLIVGVSFALTCFFSTHALAQGACRDVFKIDLFSVFDRTELRRNEDEAHMKGPVLQKILETLGPLVPHSLNIELVSDLHVLSSILLHGKDVKLGLHEASKEHLDIILAHEIGHASFLQHFPLKLRGREGSFIDLIEALKVERDQIASSPEFKTQLNEATKEMVKTGDFAGFETRKKDILRELGIEDIMLAAQEMHQVEEFLRPYNELYADLVAVLYSGRLSAPAEVTESVAKRPFRSIGEERFHPEIRERDFSTLINFKLWTPKVHELASYFSLDPARGALGKLYLENVRPEDKAKLLQAFLTATKIQFDIRRSIGETAENQESAVEVNREFVRIYLETARRLGLEPKGRSPKTAGQ